ncbi:MAG: ATP-grasp domain-containing protein [Desulfobulbus sp.]|jgi:hypothetical protein|nr:ATP-grasp domain-containing protein [Desulfobulbus sp.]
MKKNILVFPCGSEVALEIHRSLRYSTHFKLIGASSVDDHGKFVYEDYVDSFPFFNSPDFIPKVKEIIKEKNISAIFPAMDLVARSLKSYEMELGCIVIGSDFTVTSICSSKSAIYQRLKDVVPCPLWTHNLTKIEQFPVFIKPDEGYGSRNVSLAKDLCQARAFVDERGGERGFIFCEYLPGEEYTIDCFSDRTGKILFHGARKRARVSNGISVNTVAADMHIDLFKETAEAINVELRPRGAWFFQMKENHAGQPVLMEVAARLGGSSGYFRAKGVNFAMLSAFDAFDISVSVQTNTYKVVLDRALGSRYKIDLDYECVYVDFDDCLVVDNKVNKELVSFLFQSLNYGKRLILITRHAENIEESLQRLRLNGIFDKIINVQNSELKSNYINQCSSAIFIDDSFAERLDVAERCKINVFSPDMIEALLN